MVLSKVTLYHSPMDAGSRFIRLLLAEKGMDFSLQYENHLSPRKSFYSINPMGEVPVLSCIDFNICGEVPIAEYLEEMSTTNPLYGNTEIDRAESRRLIDIFMNKINANATKIILDERMFNKVCGKKTNINRLNNARFNLKNYLKYLEYLIDSRGCLHFNIPTVADFAAAAHLSSLDYLGEVEWDKFPSAKDWYARMKSRPSFQGILSDKVSFLEPSKQYANLDF